MTIQDNLNKFGIFIKKVTDSIWYVAGVNIFVLFCWIFNLVFLGVAVFLICLLLTLLTQKNINAVVPFLASIIFIVRDPGDNSGSAVIPVFMDALYIVLYCFIPFLLAAFVWFVKRNKIKMKAGSFSHGLIIFFVIALFGGAGTSLFTLVNLLTLFVWFAVLYIIYLFFYNTVDFKAEGFKQIFSFAFFCAAIVAASEMFLAGFRSGNFLQYFKTTPYVGWGTGPTIGQVLTMYLPFAFYLLAKSKSKKEVIFYNIAIIYLLGALFFSRSRAGMLAMAVAIIPLYIITHRKMEQTLKRTNLFTLAGIAAAGFIVFFALFGKATEMIASVLKNFRMSGREDLWPEGWNAFKESPIFGKGFFFVGDFPFNHADGFLYWYWYHNTALQVLANIGIIGAAAFGYYMYKKYEIFLKKGDILNFFIFMSLLITEIMSLFDIHVFAFAYCVFMLLFVAAAEHLTDESGEKLFKKHTAERNIE